MHRPQVRHLIHNSKNTSSKHNSCQVSTLKQTVPAQLAS